MSTAIDPPSHFATRAVALLVAGTLFMELLDGTIIATAAPRMARSFGVSSADISVTITAYFITVAVLIPLSGWLADRVGVRPVFIVAIAAFTVASVLCAISVNLAELAAFRVLQGVGGAMMVPVGRLVVLRTTAKADVIAAIAYLTWPALLAPVVAPALGGLLTTYASWQWIFLVNVPLGLVALPMAVRLVPAIETPPPGRLDWLGLAASAVGLGALVYCASLVNGALAPVAEVCVAAGVGVVALSLAVVHLLRVDDPLVDLRVLATVTFRASVVGGTFFRLSILAVPFLLPLMFQDDFGWSPAKAGAVVIFVFVGNLAIKPATTPLMRRLGFRLVLLLSNALGGVATIACGLLGRSTPLVAIAALLIAGGAFRSISFSVYNTLAFADIGPDKMGHANTFFMTVQQVGAGLGVAAAAIALRIGQAVHGNTGNVHNNHTIGNQTIGVADADSLHAAYVIAFVIVGLLQVPALIEAWLLPRSAGSAIGGRVRAGDR